MMLMMMRAKAAATIIRTRRTKMANKPTEGNIKKLCPLRFQLEQKVYERADIECKESECAWFISYHGGCAIECIASETLSVEARIIDV